MGWIAFSARGEAGDWDLFLCRPDGSSLRNVTRTREFNEAYPLFSRDGCRLLYRRLARSESVDGNRYGAQGALVAARSDGAGAVVLGRDGEFPWASWSPDGKALACLAADGIFIVDPSNRRELRRLPRKGFFQQMTWSPDGKALIGVSNGFGTSWSIARLLLETGEANAVSCVDCCTPDWSPDGSQVVFASRPPGQGTNNGYGWTQMWSASPDGTNRRLLYAEEGRHVYGAHVSPDGRYAVFTGNAAEDGDAGNAGAPMALMRLADAPIVVGTSRELRERHPGARGGPVLALPAGWEPCWTRTNVTAP